MENSELTTITVSPSVSYTSSNIGDFVHAEKKYYTIIGLDIAHSTLTLKPWRWYHYVYYRTKWWIQGQIDTFKDFQGRVQCAKGNHKWEFYSARFENDGVYYLRVKECKCCPEQYLQTSIDRWTRRGSIFAPEEFRNLKMTERFEDID